MKDKRFYKNRKTTEEVIYTESEIQAHEEKLFNELMKVTPEAFAEFMTTKGASTKCISCGSSDLSVPETINFREELLPENLGSLPAKEQINLLEKVRTRYITHYIIGSPNIALLSDFEFRVNCANCGHVSFYRAPPVVEWIEEQEKGLSE